MDADVIVVGAGPTGLMLAGELRPGRGAALVLERQPQIRDIPKAGGLSGQILELLRYRGELERFEAAGTAPEARLRGSRGAGCTWTSPSSRIPDGGAAAAAAAARARPRRARRASSAPTIRRGQEVVGLSQDDATVTADVRGPDGPYRVTARYLVGCDGAAAGSATWPASRSPAPRTRRSSGSHRSPCPSR